jgi:hypothetical protein
MNRCCSRVPEAVAVFIEAFVIFSMKNGGGTLTTEPIALWRTSLSNPTTMIDHPPMNNDVSMMKSAMNEAICRGILKKKYTGLPMKLRTSLPKT